MANSFSDEYYIDLWREQEAKEPLLERLSQWCKQYKKDRKERHHSAREAQKLQKFPPDPKTFFTGAAIVAEQQARQQRIVTQHTEAVDARERARTQENIGPPLPLLSFEHLTLAFEYVEESQAQALASPLVRDVVDSLQRIVNARDSRPLQRPQDRVSRTMQNQARTLLKELLTLLIPSTTPLGFGEQTLEGYCVRFNMLSMTGAVRENLVKILGKRRTDKQLTPDQLTALHQYYPEKTSHEIERWIDGREPADIAEELVAEHFTSTPGAVHKYLRQARAERNAWERRAPSRPFVVLETSAY